MIGKLLQTFCTPLLLIALTVVSHPTLGFGQEIKIYQKVLLRQEAFTLLPSLLSFDQHTLHWRGDSIETIISSDDVDQLKLQGLLYSITDPDLQASFEKRSSHSLSSLHSQSTDPNIPKNFHLGSVGGFLSIDEINQVLDSMELIYPSLISQETIGFSVEGRPIVAARLSASDSGLVPGVLFTGLIHAREPMSMMNQIYTMWSLLEGYGNDPTLTYLLQSREVWFIPLLNPDGYQFNIAAFPNGGGLWRKNRGGIDHQGTDLNRNFGPIENWTEPSNGASTNPTSDSYRGIAPFSEPEAQALRDFINSHDIHLLLSYHSFGNTLIYFDKFEKTSLDSTWRMQTSQELTLDNGYSYGLPEESIGYAASGTSEGWITTVNKTRATPIAAWAAEIGSSSDGFWPEPTRIIPLCQQTHSANLIAASIVGDYLSITAAQTHVTQDDRIVLTISISNSGMSGMKETGILTIPSFNQSVDLQKLQAGETTTFEFEVPSSVRNSLDSRQPIAFEIRSGDHIYHRTIPLLIHPTLSLFKDDFESRLAHYWDQDLWDVETVTGIGRVLSDSPYEVTPISSIPNIIELKEPIHLQGFDGAELRFDAKYTVNATQHLVRLEVARGKSLNWEAVDGDYLQGSRETYDPERNLMRGANSQWKKYSINLDKFVGSDIRLRLVMESPGDQRTPHFDGLLLDNLEIVGTRAGDLGTIDVVESSFNLFPNPCGSFINVRMKEKGVIHVEDLLGRTYVTNEVDQFERLDLSALPLGVYIVSTSSKKEKHSQVIVKDKE